MLISSHSYWPPTGHNDLNVDEQPNLKKDPTLRESKYILVSDSIANIRSCMINNDPGHTLHPTLETAFNLSARGNRYQVISPANITDSWPVYPPPTQLSSFSFKCSITLPGLYHLISDITCTYQAVSLWCQPLSAEPWHAMNMHFPTTTCNIFKQATPGALCQIGWMGPPHCLAFSLGRTIDQWPKVIKWVP